MKCFAGCFHLPTPPWPTLHSDLCARRISLGEASAAPLSLVSSWVQPAVSTRRETGEGKERSQLSGPLVCGLSWWSPGVARSLEFGPQLLQVALSTGLSFCSSEAALLTNSGPKGANSSPFFPALHFPLWLLLPSPHLCKLSFILNSP